MNIDEYQKEATKTAVYGEGSKVGYPVLGLVGEAGEIANKYKKVLRDDAGVLSETKRQEIIAEIGDVQWYIAALATDLDVKLSEILSNNLKKLNDRKSRGVIQGSGDNR
jgi:NTP pyrophosphatase (non-canonical NTP hydrolase)